MKQICLRRAASTVSTTAAAGGQWANVAFKRTWDTTAEGIRRLSGNSLVVRTQVYVACEILGYCQCLHVHVVYAKQHQECAIQCCPVCLHLSGTCQVGQLAIVHSTHNIITNWLNT